MRLSAKVKAFTLIELVVVIAVSTVVAGLSFSVIRLIQKNTTAISVGYERKSQVQTLELALHSDFNRFTTVNWDPIKEELTFISPVEEKLYQFHKDSIQAQNQVFNLKTLKQKFYFRGVEVKNKEIDALKLVVEVTKGQELCIFVFKHNDLTKEFLHED